MEQCIVEMKTGGDAQVVLLSGSRPRIVINSSERNPEKKKKIVGKVRTACRYAENAGQSIYMPVCLAKRFVGLPG